ncbi:RNA polymerase subunit sigma [Paraglaciecola hydrolytica]|uniref:RNA polymerase subunit sigma n=2 Tax=Paraglaciecola hydrolytica TaxID=1799789 RepID=A0A136A3Y4_9ALTE|nr:RNA polymerase subunit sigma [Paraglaciecola hydrolytica]
MPVPLETKAKEINHSELAAWLEAIGSRRDKVAFAQLFRFFAPKIKNFGRLQFKNEAEAMELVQETMTNVWRKAHLYQADKGAPTTWIYTVMRNMSFDMLRKIQTYREETLSEDIWPLEQTAQLADDEDFNDHLLIQHLNTHLATLPENQQQIVIGIYIKQLSHEELAQKLDLPLGTVKSRLRLALARLRLQMGEHND